MCWLFSICSQGPLCALGSCSYRLHPQASWLSALAGFGPEEATAEGESGQGISLLPACCAGVWAQLLSKNPGHVLTLLGSGNICPSPCTFRLDSGAKPASVGSFDAAHSSANSPFPKLSSIPLFPSWSRRVHHADCLAQSEAHSKELQRNMVKTAKHPSILLGAR